MGSQLHVYIDSFIESPYPSNDVDPFDTFERKHRGALSYHRLGYKPDSLLAWLPNDGRRIQSPKPCLFLDRHSDFALATYDVVDLQAQLAWFQKIYAAEIATVRALIPGAVVRFGVVAYYL